MKTEEKLPSFVYLIQDTTSVIVGSYQTVVAERPCTGNRIRVFLKYSGVNITSVLAQVDLYFSKGGEAFPEPKVAADLQTWSDRIHSLPVGATTGDSVVFDVELGGAKHFTIKLNFTATSANVEDLFIVSHR